MKDSLKGNSVITKSGNRKGEIINDIQPYYCPYLLLERGQCADDIRIARDIVDKTEQHEVKFEDGLTKWFGKSELRLLAPIEEAHPLLAPIPIEEGASITRLRRLSKRRLSLGKAQRLADVEPSS